MAIAELGHVGICVDDLELMRSFYTEMMGLTVIDEDLNLDQSPEDVHAEAKRLLAEGGPGYTGVVGGSATEAGR